MGLQLRVLDPGDCSAIEGETRICEGPAFTIGRGADNDWVLLDAQRHLSKHHCRIEYTGVGYQIVDISTNGVYLGDAAAPIGRGNVRPVSDGDILNLGSCIVRIEIPDAPGAKPAPETGAEAEDGDGRLLALRPPGPLDEPRSPQPSPTFDWPNPGGGDRIPGLADRGVDLHVPAATASFTDTTTILSASDNPSLTATSFRAPEIQRPSVPLDWQTALPEAPEEVPEPMPPAVMAIRPQAPEAPPTPIVPVPKITSADIIDMHPQPRAKSNPPPAPPVPGRAADGRALIEAFLDGAALPSEAIDLADPTTAMRQIGQAFREAVGGLRELLESRAMLKAEFRLEHTLVRARDNNPLKFSANLDGTLAIMLGRRVPGFMEAPEAIRESVRDVKAHEIAIMAGLKAALAGQLEQLSPAGLRARAEKSGVGGILPHVKKARLWEQFEDLHEQMSTEQVSASPVGSQFAAAYSTHYRKI